LIIEKSPLKIKVRCFIKRDGNDSISKYFFEYFWYWIYLH